MRMSDKQRQGYADRVMRCLVPPPAINGMTSRTETVDEARTILDGGGWTTNETAFVSKDSTDWLVACQRGDDWMFAHGPTQLAAWRQAVQRAKQREASGQFEPHWPLPDSH